MFAKFNTQKHFESKTFASLILEWKLWSEQVRMIHTRITFHMMTHLHFYIYSWCILKSVSWIFIKFCMMTHLHLYSWCILKSVFWIFKQTVLHANQRLYAIWTGATTCTGLRDLCLEDLSTQTQIKIHARLKWMLFNKDYTKQCANFAFDTATNGQTDIKHKMW